MTLSTADASFATFGSASIAARVSSSRFVSATSARMSAMPHWQLHSRLCRAHWTSSVSAARRSRMDSSDARKSPFGTCVAIGGRLAEEDELDRPSRAAGRVAGVVGEPKVFRVIHPSVDERNEVIKGAGHPVGEPHKRVNPLVA